MITHNRNLVAYSGAWFHGYTARRWLPVVIIDGAGIIFVEVLYYFFDFMCGERES
jgi:hypothetical protein